MPTQAQVLARIRADLNEGTQRFFSDDLLMQWWSDGAAKTHRVAVEMARAAKKLRNIAHPYLKRYGKVFHINVVAGTSLYTMPTDFIAEMHVTLMDASGIKERDCIDYTDKDDWMVENTPHLAPTFQRPAYAWRMSEATQLPALKLYAFGNEGVPNAAGVARLHYIRDVARISTYEAVNSVDMDDPYCETPRFYAVAVAKAKRGEDPSGFLALFDRGTQDIFGPLMAAAATGQKAQAEVAAMAVVAGESREGR